MLVIVISIYYEIQEILTYLYEYEGQGISCQCILHNMYECILLYLFACLQEQ